MKKTLLFFCLLTVFLDFSARAQEKNPKPLTDLLNRIGGSGTASRFSLLVDEALSTDGKDIFVITSDEGKPCIKGNNTVAVATGINWYLNHKAYINIAWNNLTTDLRSVALPVPSGEEIHHCTADYRYYLNYCTFSYSMAFWTWERWQKEIDWMALHGINMPLALVGADVVWKNVLTELGYSKNEINEFVAGPGFQAWWLMNNLEGWGGPNPDWWYTRQEKLATDILARMREFGMEPVLPGYSGMVPSNIKAKKGWNVADPGTWITFQRPAFLVPTDVHFKEMAALYYKHLNELMGESKYYSMDPFHEGGNTSGVNLPAAYQAIYDAMALVKSDAKWVIQSWNENPRQECLTTIEKGKLVVLDLFSDGQPKWNSGYQGHEIVYCMLHNFGGRVGLHGRLEKTINGYYDALSKKPSQIKGVGATPEGIETNPMLYDALFELPWRTSTETNQWLEEYAAARYNNNSDADAVEAWKRLGRSVHACNTSQQGTSEPIICARPNLTVNSVSTWSTSTLYYDPQDVIYAAASLLKAKDRLSGVNYTYDLVDVNRQALVDHAINLLKQVKSAREKGNTERFRYFKDKYLQLILDLDRMLATCPDFMLGHWTQMARNVTNEAPGTSVSDKNWMEWNARTQITVWGTRAASGSLHDYSNRVWSGLLKDFHYERWKKYFEVLENNQPVPDWFTMEEAWTKNYDKQYNTTVTENPIDVVGELFDKYFSSLVSNGDIYYFAYGAVKDFSQVVSLNAYRDTEFTFPITLPSGITAKIAVDFNNNGSFEEIEKKEGLIVAIPADAVTAKVRAKVELTDGTELICSVSLRDEVTAPRTISVSSVDENMGKVVIESSDQSSITTIEDVTVTATPTAGHDFLSWTDADGAVVSRSRTFTYYGKHDIALKANFVINKWGVPTQDKKEWEVVNSYQQYIETMTLDQSGRPTTTLYSTATCPTDLFVTVPNVITAPKGTSFTINWKDPNGSGLSYCRLSAYVDLNSDGDFNDEGELIEVRGNKDTTNPSLSSGSLQVLLPNDIQPGLTHVRMRFDGAWSGGWNSQTGAKPANAQVERMVYEILVDVTEKPLGSCTVEVKSSSDAQGTVTISGLGNPATVESGDRIILQAQNQTGFQFVKWTDKYGRTVSTESNYSFVPMENGTFTAHFVKELPKTLTINDWEYDYLILDGKIKLTKALSGTGNMRIPEEYKNGDVSFPIVALARDFLDNNKACTFLSIPASVIDLGLEEEVGDHIENFKWKGEGVLNYAITLGEPLEPADAWKIDLHVKTDGSAFNQWGSGLFATGDNSLADNYDGGFQFYLSKAGSLIVKFKNASTQKEFTHTKGNKEFDISLEKTKDGMISLAVTNESGTKEIYSPTNVSLNEISAFSSSIPKGIDVEMTLTQKVLITTGSGVNETLFTGCSNLALISVSAQNPVFYTDGKCLYDKSKTTLIRCLEGVKERKITLPATVKNISKKAFLNVKNLERILSAAAVPATVGLESFTGCSAYCETSADKVEVYKNAWGIPVLISVAKNEVLPVAPELVDVIELCADDSRCGSVTTGGLASGNWYTRAFEQTGFYPVYFPTKVDSVVVTVNNALKTVAVGTDFELYQFEQGEFIQKNLPGPTLPAGAYLLKPSLSMKGVMMTFKMAKGEPLVLTDGFVGNGTLKTIVVSGDVYGLENDYFLRNTSLSVSPFNGYISLEGESLPDKIMLPGAIGDGINNVVNGKINISVENGKLSVTGIKDYSLYNMQGAEVPTKSRLLRGVYLLKVDGKIIKLYVTK